MESNALAPFGAKFTQEIRFAVVIYGGSSLAIYMNGVAQELLHLVRATAPDRDKPGKLHIPEVSGTERIYRELGRMLDRGKAPNTNLAAGDPVRTRFIIDVLSGTSAGGINSVFLAKALANDLSLESLRNVWLDTADFGVLLNDSAGNGIPQKPPKALVNSPYLFGEIHKALKSMDGERPPAPSPYAEQLDLYTTFTDVQGQIIALQLADLVATERQHLHNFHFVYSTAKAAGEERNDFSGKYNPFLAFAARCTSAHPAAFEPMTLEEIEKVQGDPESNLWKKFYSAYLQPVRVEKRKTPGEDTSPEKLAKEFLTRPLSDGGVLDNSPFSFAIDQLDFRNVQLPVDRKLLYVEPSPGHPEAEKDSNRKPDFVENAVLSLSTLPSYQFIRDDIRRILDRNRLIDRVNRILSGIEEDYESRETPLETLTGEQFGNATIDDLIGIMGPAWGGYQRLRVAETTDDLVSIVARAAGFSDNADEFLAIRYLVGAWRNRKYMVRPPDPSIETENRFLFHFDLKRHIRRLKFVIRKANELSCFDTRAVSVAAVADKTVAEVWKRSHKDSDFQVAARMELEEIILGLSDVLKDLYVKQRSLTAPLLSFDETAPTNPLAADILNLKIDRSVLTVLDQPSHKARLDAALVFVEEHDRAFTGLASALMRELSIIRTASQRVKGEGDFSGRGILPNNPESPQSVANAGASRILLRYYYDHFDHFDMVSYPIIYSTNAGEELDPVEVFRIGPEDSSSPIENMEDRKRKLAGLSLGHFGALLDKPYRINDIIWGRLDCADRLITALIRSAAPPANEIDAKALEDKRQELIREAQQAIIIDETARLNEEMKKQLGLVCPEPDTAGNAKRVEAISKLQQTGLTPAIKEFLSERLREEDPLGRFVKNFRYLHKDNPRKLLETAGRGSRILGRMLDDVADQHRINSPHLTWITRLMRVFWGLVEVSLPDTWPHLLTIHLLKLLYLFEILMILGGVLLSNNAVQRFGFASFGVTFAINCLVFILRDFTLSKTTWIRGTVSILGGIVIFAALLGIVMLGGVLGVDSIWSMVQYVHNTLTGS